MFQIKNMRAEDFAFAVRITDTMNWKLVEEDFEFMLELEPQGCLVLFHDSERVGIVTTISFGKIGWLGNLIVAESHRGRGAGTLLARRAVKYLTSKNVETIGLYAYLDKIPFYQNLGFERDSEFIVLTGRGFYSSATANVREVKKEDIQGIINFDKNCFGASRRKLLEPILLDQNDLCYVSVEDGQMLGYAVSKTCKRTAELGPLMCRRERSDIAVNLLKANLNRLEGFDVFMCVPERELTILNVLKRTGFNEDFRVARMFFKPRTVKDCVYIAESLERG